MFNSKNYCEFISPVAIWEEGQLIRFSSLLERAIEKAIGYTQTTKELIDSFAFRPDPFPGIQSLKCVAEEAAIASSGGIITCLPTDDTLLGKDGLIMLEVVGNSKAILRVKRALCISFEEEFTTSALLIDHSGKMGLKGAVLDLFTKEKELAKTPGKRINLERAVKTWRLAKSFFSLYPH